MKVKYSPVFIKKLKKQNVRIKNSFKKAITLFQKDPYNLQLHNHALKKELEGYRSINVTSSDYRAIYEELTYPDGTTEAFFIDVGTHEELYNSG